MTFPVVSAGVGVNGETMMVSERIACSASTPSAGATGMGGGIGGRWSGGDASVEEIAKAGTGVGGVAGFGVP